MSPGLPPPVLEVYYSPTCAPCRLELPAVAEFARQDGSRVRVVILDQVSLAREELGNTSSQLFETAVAPAGKNPRAVLRAAGDADGILPYARTLASDGKTCSQWRGGLTLWRAQNLVAACGVTSRSKRRS
jgi:thiol-disulfide isomerase/thioredoxin